MSSSGRSINPGVGVPLAQTLDDCERLLDDECADWPEQALFVIGGLDRARRCA
jgi:F-type H+-transporting ATPase subunit beta